MALNAKDAAAFLATTTQAQAARVVGMDGKTFRDITRRMFGVYVSRDDGGTWDERTRAFRLAYHNASADARKGIVAAFKAGDATPPK
jgi:hypothetical protein